jgi:hypothetical protein
MIEAEITPCPLKIPMQGASRLYDAPQRIARPKAQRTLRDGLFSCVVTPPLTP